MPVHADFGLCGSQGHGGCHGVERVAGDLLRAGGVDQAAAGDDHLLHAAQILAGLHVGQAHQRVGLLHAARVAAHGRLNGQRGQRVVQLLKLRAGLRNHVGVMREHVD